MHILEKTKGGTNLTRKNIENAQVIYVPGLSTADPENYNRPRERKEYLEQVLNPMIERGEVGDGIKSKWDDRKFRFDSASIQDKVLELRLGITHYQECADCRKWDEEKRNEMVRKGKEIFDEPYAFFTRGCGIEATTITSDGHIFVGKRQTEDDTYAGELAAVNGWVNYKENLRDVDFRQDALREMREEYGIFEKDIDKLIFSGVFSAPSEADTDFAYLAPLRIGDKEFLDGYEKRQDKEHGELIKIANYQDMEELLQTGRLPGIEGKFDVLYSLRASLEQIKPEEMAN